MLEEDYDWIIRISRKNRELAYSRTMMRFLPRIWDHMWGRAGGLTPI